MQMLGDSYDLWLYSSEAVDALSPEDLFFERLRQDFSKSQDTAHYYEIRLDKARAYWHDDPKMLEQMSAEYNQELEHSQETCRGSDSGTEILARIRRH